jgi:superfamily I DNA/RNA helicase
MTTRTWSAQQEAIFDWFEKPGATTIVGVHGCGNLIVRARAGTGKTTTIIEGVNRAPEARILVCAFNKRIAEELTTRAHEPARRGQDAALDRATASCESYWEGVTINKGDDRNVITRKTDLTNRAVPSRTPDAVRRSWSASCTRWAARSTRTPAQPGDLAEIAINFECEPDDEWLEAGFDLDFVCDFALKAMNLAASEKPVRTGIDFSDMIFLPVRNAWMHKTHDLVVVDEAQDMTIAQLEIAQGVCRGRICVVGDDRQAIYGFRGADSGSLDRLKTELQAGELGLKTTYRCGHRIVDEAQLVPDFLAGPNNPEGLITSLPEGKLVDTADLGDFILSRLNAPLVATAMSLLRAGKRTRVAGRDIGAGLKALVKRVSRSSRTVPEFLARLAAWEKKEVGRAEKAGKEGRVEAIHDQAEMLRNLADGVKNVAEIEARIDALFTDDGLGQAGLITCSSVHRAKGLEARRVFVLAGTLKDHNVEELNIQYVAITRAKEELVWVN